MEQIFPNTIIAGFPKCGTSSMWYWLSAHPDVCGSFVKETCYFYDRVVKDNKNANFHDHGWERYPKLFKGCKDTKVIFEATPGYANMKTALAHIPEIRPMPKLIFLVREPAERLFSFYRFQKFRLHNLGDQTFSEFLKVRSKQPGRGQVGLSCYVRHLEAWQDKVGRENIEVFLMEEMMNDPQAFMKKICRYLNLDPSFYDDYYFPKGNPTVKVKNIQLHKLGSKIQPYIPHFIQNKVLIPLYLKLNADKAPPPSEEELNVKEQLKTDFKECNKELAEKFDLDLSYWK